MMKPEPVGKLLLGEVQRLADLQDRFVTFQIMMDPAHVFRVAIPLLPQKIRGLGALLSVFIVQEHRRLEGSQLTDLIHDGSKGNVERAGDMILPIVCLAAHIDQDSAACFPVIPDHPLERGLSAHMASAFVKNPHKNVPKNDDTNHNTLWQYNTIKILPLNVIIISSSGVQQDRSG